MPKASGKVTEVQMTVTTNYAQIILDGKKKRGEVFRYGQDVQKGGGGPGVFLACLTALIQEKNVELTFKDDRKNGFRGIVTAVRVKSQ